MLLIFWVLRLKKIGEIVQPFVPTRSYFLLHLSKNSREAKRIISEIFSDDQGRKYNRHIIELATLSHILKGIHSGIDGIVYLKPNMCSPCDNVSYILRKKNNFGLPLVEINYDEHSGVNGIVTRLEAFVNSFEF